jgi:hypothetical protein
MRRPKQIARGLVVKLGSKAAIIKVAYELLKYVDPQKAISAYNMFGDFLVASEDAKEETRDMLTRRGRFAASEVEDAEEVEPTGSKPKREPEREAAKSFPIKNVVQWLEREDPDWFYGGCSDVAPIVAEVAKRLGHKAKVKYGTANTRDSGRVYHAWVVIDGKKYDAHNFVLGKGHYAEHEASSSCPLKQTTDWSFVKGMVEDVIEDLHLEPKNASTREAASRPDIGKAVTLQGKRGIFKVVLGPTGLSQQGYNRMVQSGYTHWLRLESPRGREMEFYWRPDKKDVLYWYKNHSNMVPMRFEKAELPPDVREFIRKFPNTDKRELSQAYGDLLEFMDELARSGLPQADKVLDILSDALSDIGTVSGKIGDARRELSASKRTAGRKAIELKKVSGAMMEREPRYMIMFRGKKWGELYYNMRGYVAAKGIPVPSSRRPGEAAGLDIGERSINIFKKEIAKANREWAELAKTASQREAARWEKMPKGWTDESRKKFWDSLVGDVKHKVTKCIKEMEGKFDDPGAFCASLADRVDPGWRSRDKKSSEELVQKVGIQLEGGRLE